MEKCELCGAETEDPKELYGRQLCQECYEYYEKIAERRHGGCCCCR